MDEVVLSHVIDRLKNVTVRTSPFPHFYIENIFPDDYYQELIAHLPETSSYVNLGQLGKTDPRIYQQRLVLPLQEDELCRLPFGHLLFWSQFAAALKSQTWCEMLVEKFQPYIQERFVEHYDRVTFSSTAELVRDSSNYAIGPHTDHPIRVLTLLFYFPATEEQANLGTSVYEPHDANFECEGFVHHPFEGFRKVYTALFLPNSVFGFVRSNRSFHGVEPIQTQVERNLLNTYLQWNHK